MNLAREVNRLALGLLAGFALVVISAAYWAILGSDSLLRREDNPRLVEAEAAIRRGMLVDRHDEPLAISVVGDNNRVTRQYPHPETSSMVGYSSLRYGVGGAEATYNTILRGDDRERNLITALLDTILHRPQQGRDVRLALDLGIQQAMVNAMANHQGAAVALAVPTGEVLGLVSMPAYDSNNLDAEWEQLVAAPDKPFFNRVLQGNYQPGGTLETPLLAAALVTDMKLMTIIPNATRPVALEDLEMNCAVRLPELDLSLRDAYGFACPYPFLQLANQLGMSAVEDTLTLFHFDEPPTLSEVTAATPRAWELTANNLQENALGQGALTVTPLQMAVMAAAIVNDGNAPRPYTLLATRDPGADWQPASTNRPTLPYASQNTARQLQDLMRNAVANGAALNAARPGIDIGGHATLAYAGDESQAWFIGFVTLQGGRSVAVSVVLENSTDPGRAADVGGTILAAAHNALRIN
jgi:penicillin-binding protein A